MKNFLYSILLFISIPFIALFFIFGPSGNSGHTSGLCSGLFAVVCGVVVGAIVLLVALAGLGYLIFG
jgi:hypothetical protein